MKIVRRILSLVMALALCIGVPSAVLADGEVRQVPADTEVSAGAGGITLLADAAASGSCGDDVTWTLTDGVLTISGAGKMVDYDYRNWTTAPWYGRRAEITRVVIEEGVTSIGACAFYYCVGLTSVAIPDSVTSIGRMAFLGCSALPSIDLPGGVTSIGDYAFRGCSGLTSVTIPSGVTSVGDYTFCDCSGLTRVTIPANVTSIGDYAFRGCSGLTGIFYTGLEAEWAAVDAADAGLAGVTVYCSDSSAMPDDTGSTAAPDDTGDNTDDDAGTGADDGADDGAGDGADDGAGDSAGVSADAAILGDFTGDGRVNGMDLLRLKRYIAGVIDTLGSTSFADFTGDGKVNGMDLLRLKRFIAGVVGALMQ